MAIDTDPRRVSFAELGSTGSRYGNVGMEEYLPELNGHNAIRTYFKMKRNDAQVRTTLRIVKTPIIGAQWYVQGAGKGTEDKDAAEFLEWSMHNMSRTWNQVLWEATMCLDYGFYIFEKVWERKIWKPERPRAKPRTVVGLKKLAPRHPISISEFIRDSNGGVQAVKQWIDVSEATIPIDKLLLFVADEEGGNPYGFSLLRTAYKHWYYKDNLYKVDAIQKERHALGVPDVELQPGYTEKDKQYAAEMARNLRANEKAFIVRPTGMKVGFVEFRVQPVDALKSAMHHDLMIARNVLAQFINLGTSEVGARSMAAAQQDIFIKAVRYLADLFAGIFNQYLVPQLIGYNFNVTELPQIKVRRIGETADWRTLSSAVKNFTEAGWLTPDAESQIWLRDQMDFPISDDALQGKKEPPENEEE